MGVEVYSQLESMVKDKYDGGVTRDESGFELANIQDNKECLKLLKSAIDKAGHTGKVGIGMDVTASNFYSSNKTYDSLTSKKSGSNKIYGYDLMGLYKSFISTYPLISIQEPFSQDDQKRFAKMTAEDGLKVQVVQKDVHKEKSAILFRLTTIVSKLISDFKIAEKASCRGMASHEGKFFDNFIHHLCIGLSLGQLKTSALSLDKYQHIVDTETQLGEDGTYASFHRGVKS